MNSKTIYHRHHIVPRHMGGTDDPSNLVDLTVEQHAEAHRLLYEEHGKEEDRLAWLGLSGQIGKEEIIRKQKLIGAQKGGTVAQQKHGKRLVENLRQVQRHLWKHDKEYRNKQFENLKQMREKAQSPEARKKQKETLWKNNHQQGERNSQYGTMWITNGTNNKKLKKSEPIPDGWYKGRRLVREAGFEPAT